MSVPDWSGGTRIGEALRRFEQRWARRTLHGGPVVLLISDGWDRGDPAVLGLQIKRLQRSCHRLIWLNPLVGTLDYAPLTRGLQAALPFVDDLKQKFLALGAVRSRYILINTTLVKPSDSRKIARSIPVMIRHGPA
jgi:uncharacterized protein with von Willebrand factor type A (vWA) domain